MTDKEKQIEEMAEMLENAKLQARGTVGSLNNGFGMWYATALYNAGYRKMDEVTLRLDLGDRSTEEIKQIAEAFNGDIKKQVAKEIYDLIGLIPIPDKHGTHLHIGFENALSAVKIKIAKEYGVEVE